MLSRLGSKAKKRYLGKPDKNKPMPGSKEAILKGCGCPAADNGDGVGFMGSTEVFLMLSTCVLHGEKVGGNE